MPGSPHSPIASLVLFMVCLSVAGAFLAGAHYYAVDLPQQQFASHPPLNGYGSCHEVNYWTGFWAYIFNTRSCGVCEGGYNGCCD